MYECDACRAPCLPALNNGNGAAAQSPAVVGHRRRCPIRATTSVVATWSVCAIMRTPCQGPSSWQRPRSHHILTHVSTGTGVVSLWPCSLSLPTSSCLLTLCLSVLGGAALPPSDCCCCHDQCQDVHSTTPTRAAVSAAGTASPVYCDCSFCVIRICSPNRGQA